MTTSAIYMDSPALAGATTYSILLPDPEKAGPGPYHVLLQLHGMHDDHTAWLLKTRLWNYAERLPLIIVMPSGGNFWWSNLRPQQKAVKGRQPWALNYEDFLLQDLWAHVQGNFPARQDERWAIGGLSMGGYGAVRLGLKHPERFCSIYAHSSALLNDQEIGERLPFLPETALADLDCYRWAAKRTPADLPRLSFDCGVDDHLIANNRRFHNHLTQLGLPHSYKEHPGAHTWDYWDTHIHAALAQHCEVLGIGPNTTA